MQSFFYTTCPEQDNINLWRERLIKHIDRKINYSNYNYIIISWRLQYTGSLGHTNRSNYNYASLTSNKLKAEKVLNLVPTWRLGDILDMAENNSKFSGDNNNLQLRIQKYFDLLCKSNFPCLTIESFTVNSKDFYKYKQKFISKKSNAVCIDLGYDFSRGRDTLMFDGYTVDMFFFYLKKYYIFEPNHERYRKWYFDFKGDRHSYDYRLMNKMHFPSYDMLGKNPIFLFGGEGLNMATLIAMFNFNGYNCRYGRFDLGQNDVHKELITFLDLKIEDGHKVKDNRDKLSVSPIFMLKNKNKLNYNNIITDIDKLAKEVVDNKLLMDYLASNQLRLLSKKYNISKKKSLEENIKLYMKDPFFNFYLKKYYWL